MNKPKKSQGKTGQERRQGQRILKNFILSYFDKKYPEDKFEVTQLKNIGKGGMCFVTSKMFAPGTKLGVELRTPYLAGGTYLQGTVQDSHEKVKDLLYETRLQFENLDSEAELLLTELVKFFVNGERKDL